MELNDVTAVIVDAAYQIHTEIGPGLFESVYKAVLADILTNRGFLVKRQIAIPIRFADKIYDEGFRADLIVNNRVIVENKEPPPQAAGYWEKSVRPVAEVYDRRLQPTRFLLAATVIDRRYRLHAARAAGYSTRKGIKSIEQLARVHKKQVLTYLKLSGLPVGLLINFGGDLLKGNIERLAIANAPNLTD